MILPWREVTIYGATIQTSLTPRETNALRELAALGNGNVLEIGSAFGYSTVVLASVASHVVAVDPHQAIYGTLAVMKRNLAITGVEKRVTIIEESSRDYLPMLAEFAPPEQFVFDLVFIDGDHSYEAVAFDLRWAEWLVADVGKIAVHDYGEETCPGVKEAVDERWATGPKRLVDTLAIR